MPRLARDFRTSAAAAAGLAEAGEIVRALSAPRGRIHQELTIPRLEALHEMAYLRIFVRWETFIEMSFLRMMCGYESAIYVPQFATGRTRQRTLSAAQTALFGSRDFLLWHNPRSIRDRARDWFAGSPLELVAVSNFNRLEWFAAIRHRIAHGSEDARQNLNRATIGLCGRRYRGASAGRFLRDWDSSVTPPQRWLHTIAAELENLAAQITP
jgi:hypothetical protein